VHLHVSTADPEQRRRMAKAIRPQNSRHGKDEGSVRFRLKAPQKDSSIDTMLESFDFKGFQGFERSYLNAKSGENSGFRHSS
jgi:hypothetical protein